MVRNPISAAFCSGWVLPPAGFHFDPTKTSKPHNFSPPARLVWPLPNPARSSATFWGFQLSIRVPPSRGFSQWEENSAASLCVLSVQPLAGNRLLPPARIPPYGVDGLWHEMTMPTSSFSTALCTPTQPKPPPPQLRETSAVLPEDEGEDKMPKHPTSRPWTGRMWDLQSGTHLTYHSSAARSGQHAHPQG